jgi:hypothetical protein
MSSIYGFFDTLVDEDWTALFERSQLTEKESAAVRENFKYALHGLLLFFLNQRKPMEFKEFMAEVATVTHLYASMC